MQAYLKTGKSNTTTANRPTSSAINKERKESASPWVEKYRPKTVENVVEQGEVVAVLKDCLSGADLPNLLLYGPPGTGKTSTILAAARELFGDMFRDRILELNASDERGIAIVRNKIKSFAQLTANSTTPDGKPCPPFKIIILDEADSMTHAAQSALRRTMEKESRSTRFCLVCNYVSRIIEPITSRCTKFRFKTLSETRIIERLKFICEQEILKIHEDVYKTIVEVSGGDLRRAITILQSVNRLNGPESAITRKDVEDMSGVIPKEYLHEFLTICQTGNYIDLEGFVRKLSYDAYSVGQMFDQFNNFIVKSSFLSDKQKSLICGKLGECCFRLEEGGSEYLQIMDLGCTVIVALQV